VKLAADDSEYTEIFLPFPGFSVFRRYMPFAYSRTVHFADTDAAGVVFFANFLSICHEAYEEALAANGIELRTFFAENAVIVPIVKSEADYLRPLFCGDKLRVTVTPAPLSENSFEIRYEIVKLGLIEKVSARVHTVHVCTSPGKKARALLPPALTKWLLGDAAP
jgi:1,4-dihydroxy-2-naphthoyl-CoA hydrolase